MDVRSACIGTATIAAIALAVYGIHRLCLRLEARGWLHYVKNPPRGNPVSALFEIEKIVQPKVEHAIQVQHEERYHAEEELPGANDPPVAKSDGPADPSEPTQKGPSP